MSIDPKDRNEQILWALPLLGLYADVDALHSSSRIETGARAARARLQHIKQEATELLAAETQTARSQREEALLRTCRALLEAHRGDSTPEHERGELKVQVDKQTVVSWDGLRQRVHKQQETYIIKRRDLVEAGILLDPSISAPERPTTPTPLDPTPLKEKLGLAAAIVTLVGSIVTALHAAAPPAPTMPAPYTAPSSPGYVSQSHSSYDVYAREVAYDLTKVGGMIAKDQALLAYLSRAGAITTGELTAANSVVDALPRRREFGLSSAIVQIEEVPAQYRRQSETPIRPLARIDEGIAVYDKMDPKAVEPFRFG